MIRLHWIEASAMEIIQVNAIVENENKPNQRESTLIVEVFGLEGQHDIIH
jgi:hypothetical protein